MERLALFFATVFCACCVSIAFAINEKHLLWKRHEKFIQKYPCHTPQPKAIAVEELVDMDSLANLGFDVFPHSTILHRCTLTGCCKKKFSCKPFKFEEVNLMFYQYRSRKFLEISATNHTHCRCEPDIDSPK